MDYTEGRANCVHQRSSVLPQTRTLHTSEHEGQVQSERLVFIPSDCFLDYGGISASRLEVLEEKLRDDVVAEVNAFGGKLLLHTETPDGSVIPVWEEVYPENVLVLKDVMAERKLNADDTELAYARIPITAERPPDFSDLSELIDVVIRSNASSSPIVLNCQLGRGRSTMTAVCDGYMLWYGSHVHNDLLGHPRPHSTLVGESSEIEGPNHTPTGES